MKTCSKMFITTSLFFYMYILNSINAEQCSPKNCPRGVNTSVYSTEVSVTYPFQLNDQHSTSCGVPGFDLYCSENFGTLIQLPNNVVLRVNYIYYYYQQITLSDPSKCLPRKLMALNLTGTRFRAEYTQEFWLYNCSGDAYLFEYDQIDCMSGSNYTIISSRYKISDFVGSKCSFLRILRVPQSYYSSYYMYLSTVSTIDLSWTGVPTPPSPRSSTSIRVPLGVGGAAFTILLILLCCCRRCKGRTAPAAISKTTATNNTVDMTTRGAASIAAVVVGVLDQATSDS